MILWCLGCVLHNIHDPKSQTLSIIASPHSEQCSKECNDVAECDSWTQYHGTCYLKDENSFRHFRKKTNWTWTSGSKRCHSTGNNYISHIQSRIRKHLTLFCPCFYMFIDKIFFRVWMPLGWPWFCWRGSVFTQYSWSH